MLKRFLIFLLAALFIITPVSIDFKGINGAKNRGQSEKSFDLAFNAFKYSLFLRSNRVFAGFVDDWLQQKSETSGGYFEGQKRGYLTGGSFSARWQTGSDYLLSLQTPKLKFG